MYIGVPRTEVLIFSFTLCASFSISITLLSCAGVIESGFELLI